MRLMDDERRADASAEPLEAPQQAASRHVDAGSPAPPPPAWLPDEPEFEAHVLRAFIRGDRLASIPARERKKLVVYRYLLDRVLPDPGEVVQERDLNMRLALWHPDVATIRRALVDLRLATREGMQYRRAVGRR